MVYASTFSPVYLLFAQLVNACSHVAQDSRSLTIKTSLPFSFSCRPGPAHVRFSVPPLPLSSSSPINEATALFNPLQGPAQAFRSWVLTRDQDFGHHPPPRARLAPMVLVSFLFALGAITYKPQRVCGYHLQYLVKITWFTPT